jgi:hypothetical protein
MEDQGLPLQQVNLSHWCDLPRRSQWAFKSAAHRWPQRWHTGGTRAAMQAHLLGLGQERGMIQWQHGSVDGSFSPGNSGGEGVAYGRKGKGILIHNLQDGAGRANASRCWQRIRAMTPKTSADTSAHTGFAPRSPNASAKAASRGDGRLNKRTRATKPSGRLPGPNASTAGWLSAGNVWPRALMRFSLLR